MRGIFLFFLFLISAFAGAQNDFEFVPNQGQFHENVLYRADVPSGTLFLEKNALTFSFYDAAYFHNLHHGEKADVLHFHSYKIKLRGGRKSKTSLHKENNGKLNYYLGNDPSKWVTGVKGGKEVYFKGIYKNIDFRIYSKNGELKYDFIVHPGGKVSDIQLEFEGLDDLLLRGDELYMNTSLGIMKDSKPKSFQSDNEVNTNFVLDDNTVTFEVGNYDKKEDLIIDPTLVFSTYSGSLADNFGYTATYDEAGNLYAGGSVFFNGYPTTTGAFDIDFNSNPAWGLENRRRYGVSDMGITKYSSDGTTRLYSTYVGGNRCEVPHSLIVNNRNELFIFGTTSSDNYPVTASAFDPTFNGGDKANLMYGIFVNYTHGSDIVISRLSADGSAMLASTYVGGGGNDGLNLNSDLVANYADQMRGEIILDEFQNVLIGSSTSSNNFPITLGAFQNIYGGGEQDGILFKMDENLSRIIWSSYYGGTDADGIYSLINSNSNDVYIAGGTKSDDLSLPSSAYQAIYQGGITDGFYAKFSENGEQVLNGSYFGSDKYDQIYFVREDRNDQIYFYGQSDKFGDYWIHNADYNSPNSGQFISKLNVAQTELEWSTTFGSGENKINISPTAFLVDLCNKVYLSGWGSSDFSDYVAEGTTGMEVTADAYKSNTLGHDFYLMVLEDDASSLIYGSFFGGDESAEHVDGGTSRFDEKGVMYQSVCAGCWGNNDFPVEPPNVVGPENNSQNIFGGPGCNNGVFKFDFGLPTIVADFQNSDVACISDSIYFINKSKTLNQTTFRWDFGDGTLSTDTNPIHYYSESGKYDVKLVIQDPAGCNEEDSIIKTIVVLGSERYDLAQDSGCAGSIVQIGISPYSDTAITYLWSPASGLSDSAISNPVVNIDVETMYTLIISKDECSDTLTQTVFPIPFNYELTNSVGCAGTKKDESFNGFGSFSEFLWSTNKQFSDTLNNYPLDSSLSIPALEIGENKYFVKAAHNNGCQTIDSIIVWGAGSAYNKNQDTVCIGDSLTISGDYPYTTIVQNYFWSPPDSILISFNDTAIVKPFVSQEYTLIRNYGLRCVDSILFPIEVINYRPVSLNDTSVCNGGSLILEGSSDPVYSSVYWFQSGNISDTIQNGRVLSYRPKEGDNKIYIHYEDTFGCGYTDSLNIYNENFQVKTTQDSIACNEVSPTVKIVDYNPISMVDVYWETTSLFLTDSTNPSVSILAKDYYNQVWVNVTDSGGCFDSDTVIILNLAIEDYNFPDTSICDYDIFQLGIPFDSVSNGYFNWIPDDQVSDDSIADPYALSKDTIEYGLVIDNGVCRDTVYQRLNVSQISLKAYSDTTFCNTLPQIELTDSTKNGLNHFWSSTSQFSDTLLYGSDESELLYQSVPGESYVFIKVSDSIGCVRKDSIFIGAYQYDLTYENDIQVCGGEFILLTADNYMNYDSVVFEWGPSPLLMTGVNEVNALLNGPEGEYIVPVTSTSAYGCSDTDYISVSFASFDTLLSSIKTTADTLINNETAILTVDPDGMNYVWTPSEDVLEINGNQATVSVRENTTFKVVISDPLIESCLRTDSINIFFLETFCEDPYIFVPNAFSPNGDGENDVLHVRGRNITDLYFAIFNRWGEKVFETNDQSKGWDGTFRNKNSDPAVFDYYLQYFCEGDKKYFQKGNVTLIR